MSKEPPVPSGEESDDRLEAEIEGGVGPCEASPLIERAAAGASPPQPVSKRGTYLTERKRWAVLAAVFSLALSTGAQRSFLSASAEVREAALHCWPDAATAIDHIPDLYLPSHL